MADGLLLPYNYGIIKEELLRLRSNENSNLEFVHLERNAYKDETKELREQRHQEQDSIRTKKILLRGLVVTTTITALVAKINQFLTEYYASYMTADSKPSVNINYEDLCKNSTELKFN